MKSLSFMGLVLALALVAFDDARASTLPASATVLEFAGESTLFVADSDGGRVFAYQLPPATKAGASKGYNLKGFGEKIGDVLNVDSRALTYHDIAVHPVSQEVYVSLSIQMGGKITPAVVRANPEGRVTPVDLTQLPHTHKILSKTADDAVTFWRDIPAASLTITDLDFVDGVLYVSGLSTGEFASTLRQIPYPFDTASDTSHIEIYHTVHNQTETRAPIRAMTVMELNGEPTVFLSHLSEPVKDR